MKYWLTLFFIFFLFECYSQNLKGNWYGTVNTTDGMVRIVVTLYTENGRFKSYITSPELFGPLNIFFDSISKNGNKLILSKTDSVPLLTKTGREMIRSNQIKIFANIIGDTLMKGMFKIDVPSIYRSLRLEKKTGFPDLSKPQTPRPPFSYHNQLVFFKDSITGLQYRGALTIPKDTSKEGLLPAIILLPGTGSHNMDYEAGGHRLFMVLADYFTRNGYVVLRKDSRFYGDKSKNFEDITLPETVADAEAALRFLKKQPNVDTTRIGVLGHSEGGLVATGLAAKFSEIKFLILLGGPGISFRKIVANQQKILAKEYSNKYHFDFPLIKIHPDSLKALTPRTKFLFDYNPSDALSKLRMPVLALNGEKDLQVNASDNIAAIDSALKIAGNKNYKTVILPGLNHNFQKCVKCTFKEGVFLEETISLPVLELITDWLKKVGVN